MAAASSTNEQLQNEENEFVLKKGYCWSREDTLLLISLYEEVKEYFQNVNYREKNGLGMIATRMQRESRGTPRPVQCEGKWKSLTQAFRQCEDHNNKSGNDSRECTFYKKLSEVYGYKPYATASSSGLGDSKRRPKTPEKSDDE